MDFLLVVLFVAWSLGSCLLPLREKVLRTLFAVNAVLLSLALLALAVPALHGAQSSALGGLVVMDGLRAMLIVPIAIVWIVSMVAFVLWWGASFKAGVGTRQLFCLRSFTCVGAFLGILIMVLTDSLALMFTGLVGTFFMATGGVLLNIADHTLKHIRIFAVGCGVALAVCAVGIALLLIAGVGQTGSLLLTHADAGKAVLASSSALGLLGIAVTGFSLMWFMGLLPGLPWYRQGIAHFPKGHKLMMRVMLPVALFPHVLALAKWGGAAGELFVQKLFLIGSFFAALTLMEYVHAKEGVAEIAGLLMLAMAMVSLAYGPAGVIPALMLVMMLVPLGALLILGQGGVWWKSRTKAYAAMVIGGVPVVSPLFIPYGLSLGYGIQMMPIIAVIAAGFLIFTTSSLAVRISRAWSEAEPTYAERWSGHLAGVLLLVMGIYGIWFLFADSLALVVKSAGV